MTLYEFEGVRPYVHPTAFVHDLASLVGDVSVGAGSYIGPGASLRGDFGRVIVGEGANVQDNCTLHCFPDIDLVIEDEGHVGHNVVLHGCHIGRNALIGMGAVILDGAAVGESAFVGAGSLVRGNMSVPAKHLALGTPATVVRPLTSDELAWKRNGTRLYQELAQRYRNTVRPVDSPDSIAPTDRRIPRWAVAIPIEQFRENPDAYDAHT